MPVYSGYKTQKKYNINIEIPEGFEIESIPLQTRIATEDRAVFYTLNYLKDGNKIQISCLKAINNSIFAADQYNG